MSARILPRARRRRRCTTCRNLEWSRSEIGTTDENMVLGVPSFHVTKHIYLIFSDIVQAKKEGCQVCFAILRAIQLLVDPWLPIPTVVNETTGAKDEPASLRFLDSIHYGRSSVQLLLTANGDEDNTDTRQPVQATCDLLFRNPVKRPNSSAFVDITTDFHSEQELRQPYRQTIQFGFEIYSDPSHPSPWQAFSPTRHVPPKLSQERRQQLLGLWIQECNGHENCKMATLESLPSLSKALGSCHDWHIGSDWREKAGKKHGFTAKSVPVSKASCRIPPPRRLLDLSGNPRNSIKLVESDGVQATYATLSHTQGWELPRLYLQNRKQPSRNKTRFSWNELHPFCQDAVIVAAEQGIRYLWIEALCVRFNEPDDVAWHIEHLHEIYGQSYLNIALSRAVDHRVHSLGKRSVDADRGVDLGHWQIDLRKDGRTWPVFVRSNLWTSHQAFHYNKRHPPSRGERERLHYPPLFKKAWPFQERVLAPRTVHIGASELIWECRTLVRCECSPVANELPLFRAPWDSNTTVATLSAALIPHRIDKAPYAHWLWIDMWPVFCHLQNTRPADRMASIVGLATMFQKLVRRSYVAGMFANNTEQLGEQLVWGVDRGTLMSLPSSLSGHTRNTHKLPVSDVPSWTWLSMVARSPDQVRIHSLVQHHILHVVKSFQVVQVASETPPGATDTNPIHAEKWTLHVKGQLILGKISVCTRRLRHYQFIPSGVARFPPVFPPPQPPPLLRYPRPPSPPPMLFHEPQSSPVGNYVLPPLLPLVPVVPPPAPIATGIPKKSKKPRPKRGRPPGYDLITTMGMFTPDCDNWDDKRLREGSSCGGGVTDALFTYAYFLFIGRVDVIVDDVTSLVDIGLVLERARGHESWGPLADKGKFRRVGYFTAPAVPGSRAAGDFFRNIEVTDVVLV